MTPPAITFVSSHATRGGSELSLERIVMGLEDGWVRGVVALDDGEWVGHMRGLGVPVEVVATGPRAGILAGALRLRRVLARQRPALVHANGVKAALVAGLATPGLGIPVVWVKHDLSWDGFLARAIAARMTRVVAVSRVVAATFGSRPRTPVRVVANGIPPLSVDREAARAKVEALTGAPSGAPVLTMVGRLDPVKAQLEAVELLPGWLAERPDLRLLLVGTADRYRPWYAEQVHARVRELGVGGAVTFAGRREDAIELMGGSDLVVVPTMRDERGMGTEGFGLVGVEAMAVGTPVAGYADGALPEVLGECAALVAPRDRAALAAAVVRLLDDPAERARLAACGRERVAANYGLSGMMDAMRREYRHVAATRGDGGPWLTALRMLRRRRSVVLAFHGLDTRDPVGDPENHLMDPERFRTEIGRLVAAGFEFVTVAELARRAGGGPPPPGLVALSFDDGMDNNHAVLLPLLRELGVPATVYVISGLIGRANPWMGPESGSRMMTEAQIIELHAAGVEIGAHTVDHPDLEQLDEEACLDQMARSRAALEHLIGGPVETFAYPYCRSGAPAVAAARRAGFTAAVTCLGHGSWSPYELKRSMITGRDGPVAFAFKALGLYDPLFHTLPGRVVRSSTRTIRRHVLAGRA